jgi:hypothetical protein
MMAPGGERLLRVADLRGRRWKLGDALQGRPGVEVADIRRIGNYVQIDFRAGATAKVPKLPPSLVLHTGDLRECAAAPCSEG